MTIYVDIKEMPNYNSAVVNTDDSVSRHAVIRMGSQKAWCIKHGAMNCVSQDRRIWRCLTCREGCYVKEF